jgi:PAS domain S-box-containing protein
MAREKILVVEDEPDVLDLCKRILASQGYQVKGAGDGYEAMERVKGESFDLVLTDIKMPGINGMEAYQAIKEFNPDIIGVIITGYASIEAAIEAVKLGFDGFVTKPFTPDELNAAVAKALERASLERENARLRALIPLFELSEAFMTTIDLDELLDQVVRTAQRETKADRASLMLLDEASGELTIEAAVGLNMSVVAEAREKVGERIVGWVVERGEALLLDDKAPLEPKIREAMKSDRISSALCVPLKVKEDRVIGVLNLSKLGGIPFAGMDLELVSILCGQAAIAIENARLFEEEKRRSTQLALINEVGGKAASILDLDRLVQEVPRSIQEKFNYYNMALFFLDEERREVVMQAVAGGFEHMAPGEYRQSLGEGIIGFVARTGQSWLASDVSQDPYYVEGFLEEVLTKSELCVPIKLGDKVIGALDVQSIRLNDFDGADVAAMEAVADRLAIAMENARLFEETERLKAFNESIVQGVGEAILIEDTQGILIFANPAAEALLGYTHEELIGRHWTTITPKEQVETVQQETAKRSQGIISRYETALRSKEGQVIPVIVSARPLFEGGKFVGILAAFTDITERKRAEEALRQSYVRLESTLEGTIHVLVSAIERRDPYTAGHQRRVAQLACAIAKEMGLPEEQIEGIRMAAVIHDVGKVNVPAEILSKPGRLNDIEFGLIKMHPQVGYDILSGVIEFLWPIAEMVLQHHERMDGSGYPQGLSGEEILPEARILAVADVVEAMSSHRPYRPAHTIDEALEEISQNKGVLYDPEVVEACLKLFKEKGFKFE